MLSISLECPILNDPSVFSTYIQVSTLNEPLVFSTYIQVWILPLFTIFQLAFRIMWSMHSMSCHRIVDTIVCHMLR